MDLIESVTFDVTISDIEGRKRFHDSGYLMHNDAGVEVSVDDKAPYCLVLVMATVLSVRSRRERGVHFDLACDTEDRGEMKRVRGYCKRLSKGPKGG